MFAIDGIKLPANASKAKSGTRADYQRQVDKMERAAKQMLEKHQSSDCAPTDDAITKREAQKLERLQKEAQQLRDWLKQNPEDRKGSKGSIRLSNRTDNESAKMATSKGVIQGYTGVATVDEKAQIIVDAQAHGTGSEQELLLPVINATATLRAIDTVITADAGYHSHANLKALAERLWNKAKQAKKSNCFKPADFRLADDRSHCVCPAGKRLYSNGSGCTINGYAAMKFSGAKQDCVPCKRRKECLRTPEKTQTRQVSFFQGKRDVTENHIDRMKVKIDSDAGREMITRRFATVEPVFGNLRGNKRLHRFTLRGKAKVDGQWKLYCMMHNIEKLAHHGYAQ